MNASLSEHVCLHLFGSLPVKVPLNLLIVRVSSDRRGQYPSSASQSRWNKGFLAYNFAHNDPNLDSLAMKCSKSIMFIRCSISYSCAAIPGRTATSKILVQVSRGSIVVLISWRRLNPGHRTETLKISGVVQAIEDMKVLDTV